MPIVHADPETYTEDDADAVLLRPDGRLTLEGQVAADFIGLLDLSEAFEALAELLEPRDVNLAESEDGAMVEDADGDAYEVDELDGEVVAEAIDTDDLLMMFESYVHDLPETTTEEKVRKSAARGLLGEEDAITEMARGSFRKIHKQGPAGKALVNRMLGAMMAKQVIKRAKAKAPGKPRSGASGFTNQGGTKGAGYKGGDYEKNPPGYGTGTARGLKVWRTFKKGGTGKAAAAKQERKTQAAKKTKFKATMKADKVKQVIAKAKSQANPNAKSKLRGAVGENDEHELLDQTGRTALSEGVSTLARLPGFAAKPAAKPEEPAAQE